MNLNEFKAFLIMVGFKKRVVDYGSSQYYTYVNDLGSSVNVVMTSLKVTCGYSSAYKTDDMDRVHETVLHKLKKIT